MEETPQTETTGDIEKTRRDALAIRAKMDRLRSGRAASPIQIRERAWELYRDGVKDIPTSPEGIGYKARLETFGIQCLAKAKAFEEAMDDADRADAEVAAARGEFIEEPGQPFGPALRPSERGQGIVAQPDVPRLDPSEIEGLDEEIAAAETFLEGGNRSD